jgi:glyoxylase-like metal-dependent hydrolase (beta-lactamase superfamily II)
MLCARFIIREMLGPLDLLLDGQERALGAYVLETDEGPAVFDCGPSTTLCNLDAALAGHGLDWSEIRHVLLSHIHLDHAGGAGNLARRHPHLTVWVSELGAPHLIDPSRLEASARRLFGASYDRLWGETVPVPAERIRIVGSDVLGLDCFPSPGHAAHHVTYLDRDGVMFNGDASGVRIAPCHSIFAGTPPPEIDLEAWAATFDEFERRQPERVALFHFGVFDAREHLPRHREQLAVWSERVRGGMGEEEFVALVHEEVAAVDGAGEVRFYELPAPAWQGYRGLRRYWDKRGVAEAAAPR